MLSMNLQSRWNHSPKYLHGRYPRCRFICSHLLKCLLRLYRLWKLLPLQRVCRTRLKKIISSHLEEHKPLGCCRIIRPQKNLYEALPNTTQPATILTMD